MSLPSCVFHPLRMRDYLSNFWPSWLDLFWTYWPESCYIAWWCRNLLTSWFNFLFIFAWNPCHSYTDFHFSKTLSGFRDGEIDVLVSSDAMTRGMDVEGVRNVINYDMPPYIKTYIHRAGRTARAGQSGCCFTLLRKNEVMKLLLVDVDILAMKFQLQCSYMWRNVNN